jgi:HSP20 family protein
MALIRRNDPFADLWSFPGSLQLFEDSVNRLLTEPTSTRPWAPPVDILENENELVLKADLPEVELKDIDIQVENNTLTLKGERKFERKDESGGYHRIERNYGSFMRCFSLPDTVNTEGVKAEYKNGVLVVTLPKKEVAKPKTIKIQATSN